MAGFLSLIHIYGKLLWHIYGARGEIAKAGTTSLVATQDGGFVAVLMLRAVSYTHLKRAEAFSIKAQEARLDF